MSKLHKVQQATYISDTLALQDKPIPSWNRHYSSRLNLSWQVTYIEDLPYATQEQIDRYLARQQTSS